MSTPFDLHVLSTPPAFILSQDQTLNKMVSKERLRSSNHLIEAQFIASKKLNQEPSSSSLRLLRRTSRPFWCFVFLSRCLIYKVHAPVSFSADVLFILALTLSLVKNFFQTFLRFFSLSAVLFVLFKQVPASRRELIQFTTLSLICQALFSARFRKSVRLPPGLFHLLSCFFMPSVRRSVRIPAFLLFVNPFFKILFFFLKKGVNLSMCVSLALSLLAAPGIFDMADHPLAIQLRMGDKAVRAIHKHPAPHP